MKLINRNYYLEKLINVMDTPDIKIITGVRRCGKSKLLESFKNYVIKNVDKCNIIHINFNFPENNIYSDYESLYNFIESSYDKNKKNYVFIDEIQMCNDFEKAINGLHAKEKYDIYLTGSNAFLLSSDLATFFTGRTFSIELFPFSFNEFINYYGFSNFIDLDKYLLTGGMSGSYVYKTDEEKYKYLNEIYNTLIIRDINQKHNIRNITLMERLNDYLMDNIGNLISSRSIAKYLSSNNEHISDKTINSYLNYLCNAFAFYKVRRYDIQGKKYLMTQNKYYLVDHTFKFARLGTKNMNYGRIYENMVAIELLRRGYEIYVGVLYKKEIDFVAVKRNEKIYIQVCDNISLEETFEREVTPLLQIKDAYPKILIANTRHDTYQYEGVQIIDIANWLSEKQ